MFGINILGIGSYLPKLTVDNAMMSEIVDTNDEWIYSRTGMSVRHMANGETTWYMGAMAAKQAVLNAGIDPKEIGLVIDSTVTNDFFTPSVSCIIQNEIGAVNAAAFDLNAACSGFVYALDTAKRFLQTDSELKYVLVVSNEMLSSITNYEDRSTCVLFGDAAAAFIIERSEKLYSSYLSADGSGATAVFARNPRKKHPFYKPEEDNFNFYTDKYSGFNTDAIGFVQDGRTVYKFATQALPTAARNAAEKAGITIDEIDWFIPHQANIRIIETAAKNIGVSLDKFIINIEKIGNTSSATIPLAFEDGVKDGRIKRGDKCCLVGFGGGLTMGCAIIEY